MTVMINTIKLLLLMVMKTMTKMMVMKEKKCST